jgi:hypothetical protein
VVTDLVELPALVSNPNSSSPDYVWLLLRLDDDMPIIEWRDEWRFEDFTWRGKTLSMLVSAVGDSATERIPSVKALPVRPQPL